MVDSVKCPKCEGTNVSFEEYVRRCIPKIGVRADGVLVFDPSADSIEWEDCKDEHLRCEDCNTEFPLPEGLDYDFGDTLELE